MFVKAFLCVSSILNSVGSLSFSSINNLVGLQHNAKIKHRSLSDEDVANSEISSVECCRSCGHPILSKIGWTASEHEGVLSGEDVEKVVKNLGLGGPVKEAEMCRDCGLFNDIFYMLEKKEASWEELKKAFSVFDKNGDGLIDAAELQMVMFNLELKEGFNLEECKKMIRAFDENGDGMIDLHEFKNMLENVT